MTARILVLTLGLVSLLNGQGVDVLEQRITDRARRIDLSQFLSASRYVPVTIARGLGSWSSPASVLDLGGIPYSAFPLNLVSADYAPIDLLLVESVETSQHPVVSPLGVYGGGTLAVRLKKIPDTLTVRGRVYGGSETGDVILDEYTADSLPFFNRNKIGFSGAVTVSDRIGRFKYRVLGGGFTYFSVGYEDRDAIIIPYIDVATFSRPNRHWLASLEAEYSAPHGGRISVFTGLNAYEAWEQIPFLPTFALFSGWVGTVRLSAEGILPASELHARTDRVSVSMREQLETAKGRYNGSVHEVHLVPRFRLGKGTTVKTPLGLGFHEIDVPDGQRQLFFRRHRRSIWSAAAIIDHKGEGWRANLSGRLERGLSGSRLRSVSAEAEFSPEIRQRLMARISSVQQSPTFLELYGSFSTRRFRPTAATFDTFLVTGNEGLQPETIVGGELVHMVDGPVRATTTLFFYRIHDLIDRRNQDALRSAFPGDLVFSGSYVNHPSRSIPGFEWEARADVAPGVEAKIHYMFTENSASKSTPRHRIRLTARVDVTFSTVAQISLRGSSETLWSEFMVDAVRDDRLAVGTNAVIPEQWVLDCSLTQNLGRLFFFGSVSGKIELQNLLNRDIRTFPLGVTEEFAVIGYLSLAL